MPYHQTLISYNQNLVPQREVATLWNFTLENQTQDQRVETCFECNLVAVSYDWHIKIVTTDPVVDLMLTPHVSTDFSTAQGHAAGSPTDHNGHIRTTMNKVRTCGIPTIRLRSEILIKSEWWRIEDLKIADLHKTTCHNSRLCASRNTASRKNIARNQVSMKRYSDTRRLNV